MAWAKAALCCLLLLLAGCAGASRGGGETEPKSAGQAAKPSSCDPGFYDFQDAYAGDAPRASRVFYARFAFSDCETLYGLGLEGRITDASVLRLLHAYLADSRENEVSFLLLNSPGGSVQAGLQLAEFIIDEQLIAIVGEEMVCVSICSFAFITASSRVMAESARLGIHSASDYQGRAAYGVNHTLASILTLVPGAHAEAYLSLANGTPPDAVTWLSADQAEALGFTD